MLTYSHMQALERLCDDALALHVGIPNPTICRGIQEELLQLTLEIERRLTHLREEAHRCRKGLSAAPRKTKEEAAHLKTALSSVHHDMESNKNFLAVLKIVGDTIAFAVLDTWDIKPLSFKEGPGYLSGKEGLALELDAFRICFDTGGIAILNDLTTCLRHGDVTFVHPQSGRFALFEAKSSTRISARGARQKEAAERVMSWLATDRAKDLYDLSGTFVRGGTHAPPRYNDSLMRRLVKDALTHGTAVASPENGLTYVATTTDFSEELARSSIQACRGKPIIAPLSASSRWPEGHRPVSLLLGSGKSLIEFQSGGLILVVVVDSHVLLSGYESRGLAVKFSIDDERPLQLTHRTVEGVAPSVSIGEHVFERLFTEALSLQWFLEETSILPIPPQDILSC